MTRLIAAGLIVLAFVSTAPAQRSPEWLVQQSFALFRGTPADRQKALDMLIESGRVDAAPILILAMRFALHEYRKSIAKGLEKLTGASPGDDWAASTN